MTLTGCLQEHHGALSEGRRRLRISHQRRKNQAKQNTKHTGTQTTASYYVAWRKQCARGKVENDGCFRLTVAEKSLKDYAAEFDLMFFGRGAGKRKRQECEGSCLS
eukprot:3901695-Amphidinium_carterae.2